MGAWYGTDEEVLPLRNRGSESQPSVVCRGSCVVGRVLDIMWQLITREARGESNEEMEMEMEMETHKWSFLGLSSFGTRYNTILFSSRIQPYCNYLPTYLVLLKNDTGKERP